MTVSHHPSCKSFITALDGCEVTWGRFKEFPKHSHDGLMLSIIDSGCQPLAVDGTQQTAIAGTLVAISPDTQHASKTQSDWWFRSLVIPRSLSTRLLGHTPDHFHCDLLIQNTALINVTDQMFRSIPEQQLLQLETLMSELLSLFYRHHCHKLIPERPGNDSSLAPTRAREYLAAHKHRNVSLTELAQASGMDGFHLNRAFRRNYGLPPHAWHLQYRLRFAQTLLKAERPIIDVALACGFTDQAHFSKAFKRLFGITPANFRAQQCDQNIYRSLADWKARPA